MMDAIRELKVRAEILHGRIAKQDPAAIRRLKVLPSLRRVSEPELVSAAAAFRLRHCLTVVAAELGFPCWLDAKRAVTGQGEVADFGTMLCPEKCASHFNQWFVHYERAAQARELGRGYLLGYRRQFFVVDRYYIESLGLDPDDPDWQAMGFDWVRPLSVEARTRLYAKLLA